MIYSSTKNDVINDILTKMPFLPGDLLLYTQDPWEAVVPKYSRVSLIIDNISVMECSWWLKIRTISDILCNSNAFLILRKSDLPLQSRLQVKNEALREMIFKRPHWTHKVDYLLGGLYCFRFLAGLNRYDIMSWIVPHAYNTVGYYFVRELEADLQDILMTVKFVDFEQWEPIAGYGNLPKGI